MIRIKRKLIEAIAGISLNLYPKEFIGLLRKNSKGEIAELLLIPNSTFGFTFSAIRDDMVPMGLDHCGSIHSHPSGNAHASDADVNVFHKMGGLNIIIAYPFNERTVRLYDSNGTSLDFEVVE